MESTVAWLSQPDSLAIIAGELHIWRVPLDVSADSVVRSSTLLSPEERARADRFVFARDRQHFTAARAALRLLLGRYLQAPPESLRIETGPQSKPFLVENSHPSELRFNLSHSHGLALFAFALHRELGIDVE